MRAISPSPRYSIQVFEGDEQIVVDDRGHAKTVEMRKPVIANFDQGGLLDHEIEAALENFNFSGIPEGVNPLTRVSSFDTEAYGERFPVNERKEKIAAIDARLRELAFHFPSQFLIVDVPPAAKPWPSYDDDTPKEIIKFRNRLGIDPETVRLYESEHKDRAEIIEAMFRLENPEAAEAQYGPADEDEPEEAIIVAA